ncbi:TPA: hypothetical protein ACXHW4_004807, partial [Enterobacter hormaechei]
DLWSRSVIGWSMSSRMTAQLACDALQNGVSHGSTTLPVQKLQAYRTIILYIQTDPYYDHRKQQH